MAQLPQYTAINNLCGGAHFGSDVYAGEIAGAVIIASLLNRDDFRNQFKDMRNDFRKAVGLSPQIAKLCSPVSPA